MRGESECERDCVRDWAQRLNPFANLSNCCNIELCSNAVILKEKCLSYLIVFTKIFYGKKQL